MAMPSDGTTKRSPARRPIHVPVGCLELIGLVGDFIALGLLSGLRTQVLLRQQLLTSWRNPA